MPRNHNDKEKYREKVLILGDAAVGKTTLTKRFLSGVFEEDYKLTIGMDFYVKKVEVDDEIIKLQIWDFAGEDKFRFILPNVLFGAKGAIFMYDITRIGTFNHLNDWLSVFQKANQKHNQEVPVILVGGKLDLEDLRTVPKEKGAFFAQKNDFQGFLECSSKTGYNVEKVFKNLARVVIEQTNVINEF
ncbi:MAG: Rab family GTPase [Promethearchaeia archaeon]